MKVIDNLITGANSWYCGLYVFNCRVFHHTDNSSLANFGKVALTMDIVCNYSLPSNTKSNITTKQPIVR